MRHFIDIVEQAAGFKVPDFRTFVTDDLINHLISTGEWSSHGSGLDEWWDEGALDYFKGEDRSLRDMPFNEALTLNHAATTAVLRRFLEARAGWIQRSFQSGDHGIPPITPESPIHRAICVNDAWLAEIAKPQRGALPLGIFWGLDAVEPWGAKFDEVQDTHPHVVEITTRVKHVMIDWEETFRSRLDWLNGDNEQEVQLFKGSPIDHVEQVRMQSSNTQPELARALHVFPVHPSRTFIA